MIKEFVDIFMSKKGELEIIFRNKYPDNYGEIVKNVISILSTGDYGSIDPNRIHVIDDGGYQGTLLYVIAATGYQPSSYWYVKVDYGSCSGCDTLEAIRGYTNNNSPTESQIKDYMSLALHIVQGLNKT